MPPKTTDHKALSIWVQESDNYAIRSVSQLQEGVWVTPHILSILEQSQIVPRRTLEVGCSHGHNLRAIHERYGCEVVGIEPGSEVLEVGKREIPYIDFRQAYAHHLPFDDDSFDLTFATGVFTWVPRNYYLGSVAELLRVSSKYVLLGDFCPSFSYSTPYKHVTQFELRTWKHDFEPFLASLPYVRVRGVWYTALLSSTLMRQTPVPPDDWSDWKIVLAEKLDFTQAYPVRTEESLRNAREK